MIKRLFLISLLWSAYVGFTQAQPAPSPAFPAERHAELREEMPFTPPDDLDEPEPEPTQIDPIDWEAFRLPLTILAWILVATLLSGLAYLLLRHFGIAFVGRAEPTADTRVSVEEIEEERMVQEGVDESLLERAERAEQYDIAVRLRYIALLKQFNDAGLIRYRRDYTGRDYRHQLSGHALQPAFTEVTKLYERYWYGRYPIDQLSYRLASRKFTDLESTAPATAPQ